MEAKARGATIIHVDPRFTRTSAVADLHVPIRAGSDIAFLGGIINYIITHERYFKEYVLHYTNASAIVGDAFRDTEDLDGLFSGWDPAAKRYDVMSWHYQDAPPAPLAATHASPCSLRGEAFSEGPPQARAQALDPSLQHPRCVLQILKRHFARYTPEMVEQVCGSPPSSPTCTG